MTQLGNPHIGHVEQLQSLMEQRGHDDDAVTMVAESNLAVAFELRTIAFLLAAHFDVNHTDYKAETHKITTENVARRLM